jgi:replicative DNA helicase
MSTNRALPNALEAEKGVLCALLNSPEWTLTQCETYGVTAASFYTEAHTTVFETVKELVEAKRPIDFVTVVGALQTKGKLEDVGNFHGITALTQFVGTYANTGAYLEEIADKYTKRQMWSACMSAANDALTSEKPALGLLDSLAGTVASLSAGRKVADIEPIKEAVMDKLRRMTANEPRKNVIKTGIDGLDRHSPMNLGDMPVISGERKAGKSMLSLTILAHIGLELKKPVAVISLEDRTDAVIDRLTASIARVPCWRHHAQFLKGNEDDRLNAACMQLAGSKIYIKDDLFDLGPIVSFIKRLKAKEPDLAAVVVDYAQLVRAKEKGDTRENEVARISRTFRLLAMELRVAILLLCQLNTEGDARESKQIEMDATAMWKVCNAKEPNSKLLAIPFQRNGASNIAFPLTFLGEICRFENQSSCDAEEYTAEKPTKRK